WLAEAEKHAPLCLSLMMQKSTSRLDALVSMTARSIAPYHKQISFFYDDVREWMAGEWRIALFASTEDKARGIMRSLADAGIKSALADHGKGWQKDSVLVFFGALSQGFEVPSAKLAVIAERDILGQQKKRARPQPPKGKKIAVFRDINVGDYVVHNSHGIGKYVGVETITVAGIARDYLHIRYAGDDKLYVPTEQVGLLQKYIGNEGDAPKLSRMGGADWVKAKSRARKAVVDIAKELVSLYAERKIKQGIAFDVDTPWQREFEDAFPYEETADQRRAIEEIKRDMERVQPMDRLLCGDVGFGKTEVAVRAAFKAVVSGRQVAVLVPTTVLAQQHYQTFASRCEEFGVRVGVINRFRSAKEQKETLKRVEEGQIDILIGTHRLLNSEIRFRSLGLLIVDEEQRFGVSQKEKMKQMSVGIDVLTLSATPIPRTLHMSLVGARDMSIIETPPEERYPVETYVLEYQESLIRSAIRREIKRGGQVYFVYNRVETIDKMREELQRMMPDARIQTAHGQMAEELLEQVMLDFYEGKSDILVCTSIIENGLDVPNANTIIVYDSDHFGLSQLYQMRGRVGRSKRTSFAYFTYRQGKVLTEVAAKRLSAIREFTRLGAGFKIAMRDLEIRGAGNLLGAQQHGHIAGVGFEMYCHMLDEEIRRLKNEDIPAPEEETTIDIAVEAYLPESYVAEASYKMELYQRLAAIRTEEELSDLTDEMIDRFGDVPDETARLLEVTSLRTQARTLGIRSIAEQPNGMLITFGATPKVEPTSVLAVKEKYGRAVTIQPGPPPTIRLSWRKKDGAQVLKQARILLDMLTVFGGGQQVR
ncbi:MAG: transcription-repair coupling factor, partial [Selenomonadales bacterium]|nr:transcription-repair coupling factor [Selenomonadales bacterium]